MPKHRSHGNRSFKRWWGLMAVAGLAALFPFRMLAQKTENYVLLRADGSVSLNGSSTNADRARALRNDSKDSLFWFEHGGRSYVIRDAAIVRSIEDVLEPQIEIGRRQAAVGTKQAKIGEQQAEIGRKQMRPGLSREEKERLGREMAALGQQMEKLGGQMKQLGLQHEKLSLEASRKLQSLLDQAIADRVAEETR